MSQGATFGNESDGTHRGERSANRQNAVKTSLWLVATVFATLGRAGCSPSQPTPSPSPSPTPLMGKPNATVLANLDVVRQIEKGTGRSTIRVWVRAAGADAGGIVEPGNAWHYTFAERTVDGVVLHDWAVRDTGEIEPRDVFPVPGLDILEIGPSLRIDSDEAARLARTYGGQAYFDRFSGAYLQMSGRYIGGKVVWDLLFQGAPPIGGDICEIPMVIDATTGELLYQSLACLNR